MALRGFTALLAVLVSAPAGARAAGPPLDIPSIGADEIAAALTRQSAERSLNTCFESAYDALVTAGCSALDEAAKRRLAIYCANCHLEATGRTSFPCPPSRALTECGREMDAVAYAEFSSYTRHVDLLCYSTESKRWREETANVITRLTLGASSLASQVTTVQAGLETYAYSVQRTIADTESSYSALAQVVSQLSMYTQAILVIQGVVARNFAYLQVGSAAVIAWPRSSGGRRHARH